MPEESNQSKFENYSLNFNGSDNRIQIPYTELNGSTNCTISFWAKINYAADSEAKYPLHLTSGTNNPILWIFPANGTALDVYIGTVNFRLDGSFNRDIAEWNHWVLRFDGTGSSGNRTFVYQNGQQLTNQTGWAGATSIATASHLILGGRNLNATQWYYQFPGDISDVSIFDYTLTEQQITSLYNSNTPINPMAITPPPITYYPLGGGSTGDAADPATTLTVPNESVPSATVFDFLAAPTYSRISLGTSDFIGNKSISFWLNKNVNNGSVFAFGNTNYYPNVQSTTLQLNNGSTTILSTGTINLNEWNHYVITGDGTTAKCYVNGVYKSTGIDRDISSAANWIGGQNNGTGMLNGELSNIQKWNAVLSDGGASIGDIAGGSISTLYNNGVPYTGTQPQAANLKGWWKMNVDTSNWNGSDWIIGEAQANYSSALDFDGTVGEIALTSDFVSAGEFTLSLWINPDNVVDNNFLGDGASSNNWIQIKTATQLKVKVASTVTTFNESGGNNLTASAWNHVLVYRNASNDVGVYVNGQTFGSPSNNTNTLTLSTIGRATGIFFEGNISNTAFWTSDQSANVATLYNGGTPEASISFSPTGWWKLDNLTTGIQDSAGSNNGTNNGATVTDIQVSTLNGISSGMTTANLVNSDLTRSIPYSSYSMVFDGLTEDIRCGNSLGSSLSQAEYVTVSCWVYFNDTTEEQGLWNFRSGDNTNDVGTSLSLYSSGTVLRLAYYEGGNNGYVSISNPGFSNENWYNIICVYDKGAAGKIYINGQAQTVVDSGVYSTVDFSSDNFYIGSYYSSTYATNGNLSNIAVWNSELTSDKVLTVYNGGVPSDISSLSPTRWWSLSGDSYFNGNDWICPNLTSSSNNGTSYNLGPTDLIGNGPGSTANGIATSMDIPANLKGNAPNSSKNAFSINMNSADRVEDVPA